MPQFEASFTPELYTIRNGEGLYWSNVDGWSDEESAAVYTSREMGQLDLPIGGKWVRHQLTEFERGYFEAMEFTEEEQLFEYDELGTIRRIGCEGFSDEAIAKVREECKDFQETNAKLLETYYSLDCVPPGAYSAGTDFWFTRNRHGTGFWDRCYDPAHKVTLDALSKAAKAFGEQYVTLGDDGKLYVD
jgi:hypothetical protein